MRQRDCGARAGGNGELVSPCSTPARRHRVFSRAEILDKLWEIDKVIVPGDITVRTHITNLRHKLKEAGMAKGCIETVYGLGYRLRGDSN